eukprot:2420675-Rhodomonas_salina.1
MYYQTYPDLARYSGKTVNFPQDSSSFITLLYLCPTSPPIKFPRLQVWMPSVTWINAYVVVLLCGSIPCPSPLRSAVEWMCS